jgi:acid stress-induced BolA-like protein IbaG/YrbA
MTVDEIKQRLLSGFENADITIDGDGCNCSAMIVSDEFEGVSLLNRQKKVLALVSEEIKSGELHALTIKARTNSEL